MNFAWLNQLLSEVHYEEVKVIGKNIHTWENPCHAAALLGDGEKVQLYVFMKAEAPKVKERETMREFLRNQAAAMEQDSIKCLKTDGLVLEVAMKTGCYMDSLTPELFVYLSPLIQAGWRMPEDSELYGMEWEHLILEVYDLKGSGGMLPDLDQGTVSITWMPQCRNYLIEKPLTLLTADASKGITGEAEAAFTIEDPDGGQQEGICYINQVELVDVWKETKEHYEDPEYQKRALEHVTMEEFQEMKRHTFQALAQDCPEGMCYAVIQYETTLDVSLDFYCREQLDAVPKASGGSGVMMLMSVKPDKETGSHGLEMRAAAIQVPMEPDTKQIQAELVLARRMLPEREETL